MPALITFGFKVYARKQEYLVRRLRTDRDWSQERLAAEAGDLRQGLMSDIELGKANPTLTTLESIAGALGVSVGELFASPAARRR